MTENDIEIKNNTIIHKDNSLNRLDLSFLKHIELEEYKKSDLLAYWINDFAVYHDEERTFNISKSVALGQNCAASVLQSSKSHL